MEEFSQKTARHAEAVCGEPRRAAAEFASGELVGVSALFRQVLSIVDTVASNDCVVLLEGESGTGKELLARRIHSRSGRFAGAFIPVNCPGVSETLFESQFYGHVRGAFTGAATDTLGVVRAANGGTLLLDEVGELAMHLQPKLLRLLQEREVTPVGAPRPVRVDVRFIAATNRSLAKCVAEGKFRSDLYHRLNVVRIEIPPLRSRPDDILPLLNHYLEYYAAQYRMTPRRLSASLTKALLEYPWPGNVRELCGYVERLYAANLPPMPPGMASWDDGYWSSPQSPAPKEPAEGRMPFVDNTPVCCSLAQAEAKAIRDALQLTNFNRSEAARILNIHRSTLLRKLRSLGL
ncbi:MAG: sigma-54 interaction domain-containing protein [Phycisphaerae bacterium]